MKNSRSVLVLALLLLCGQVFADTTTTLSQRATGETITQSFFNDLTNALNGSFVGRNSSGVPTSAQSLGTAALPWGTLYAGAPTFTGTVTLPSGSITSSAWNAGTSTMGLGVSADPSIGVSIYNTALTGTTVYGAVIGITVPSNVTSVADGFFTSIGTANAAFTTTAMSNFRAGLIGKGASHTITRLINFRGETQTAGTNNAFITDNITFTGNWFINQSGSAASTLGGALTVVGQLIGKGTSTNDAATAGNIGESFECSLASLTALSTPNDYNNICTFTVTAGDWLVSGGVSSDIGTAVTPVFTIAAIGTSSGGNTAGQVVGDTEMTASPPTSAAYSSAYIAANRMSFSASQALYLKCRVDRTSGTPGCGGRMTAVRIR